MLERRKFNRFDLAKSREVRLFAGNWHLLPKALPKTTVGDGLAGIEDRRKDRTRLASLFRFLCLQELSGEVMAGYFFKGISGPQFISPQGFRYVQRNLSEETVYWI